MNIAIDKLKEDHKKKDKEFSEIQSIKESLFDERAEFVDMGSGQTMNGIEENMKDARNWKNTFSDMKVTALRHVESGNVVVTEMQFEGTNNCEM